MAVPQGIFVVQEHSHWNNSNQLLVGKVTVEVNTPLGSFVKEFVIDAADVVSFAAQIINLLSQLAVTHQVDVLPFNTASFNDLSAAITVAQEKWPIT